MTEPDRKFEEEIRRALYAAGDLIVPAGDGLNKIRDRAARRPFALGWLLAYAAHLLRRLVHGGRVAASEVAATMHGHSSLGLVFASARRWPGKARHVLRTPSVWLRPVLASATALILLIGVMLAIPRVRNQLSAQLASALGNSSHHSSGGGGGAGAGGAQSTRATPMSSGTMAGKPFLATMPPPGTRCRGHDTGYVPPSLGPAVSRPTEAGTNGVVTNSATCFSSTSPSKINQASSLPTPPTTAPVTSPPTTPVTSTPPTTPVTTPPTSTPPTTPVTTPPTSTPPTSTPPTSTPPTTSTSSANSPAFTGPPTGSATPGG